jgi:hypothetical protein
VKRWWRSGSGNLAWLEPFSDRVPGADGFGFDVEYHIEILAADADALSTQYDPCIAAVRTLVEPALAQCDVLRSAVAQQSVNLQISRSMSKRELGAVIRQCQVSVRVGRETAESARRHAKALMDAKAHEVGRDAVRAQMRFLETEVLRNPATLRVYILATEIMQDKSVSAKGVDELESLARLVYEWSPEATWVETAKILNAHLGSLPCHEVSALLSTLRKSIQEHDNPALVDRFDRIHHGQQADSLVKGT